MHVKTKKEPPNPLALAVALARRPSFRWTDGALEFRDAVLHVNRPAVDTLLLVVGADRKSVMATLALPRGLLLVLHVTSASMTTRLECSQLSFVWYCLSTYTLPLSPLTSLRALTSCMPGSACSLRTLLLLMPIT